MHEATHMRVHIHKSSFSLSIYISCSYTAGVSNNLLDRERRLRSSHTESRENNVNLETTVFRKVLLCAITIHESHLFPKWIVCSISVIVNITSAMGQRVFNKLNHCVLILGQTMATITVAEQLF